MLSSEAIEKKVIEIVSKYLPDRSIESLYTEDYKLDSLSLVNFIIELEDTFEIEIKDEMIQGDSFKNTKNVVEFIEYSHREANKPTVK